MPPIRYRVLTPPSSPTMIYDGDCTFCRYWVSRWRSTTRGRIIYTPLQELGGDRFPEVPRQACERSVHLIMPDGNVYSGAGAVFQALACGAERRWPLWCYEKIPGVAPVTEWFYHVVAKNRPAFSFFTRLLWGDSAPAPSYFISCDLFLRLLGLIYFIAFVSLWTQILGLVGSNGILPVTPYLEAARDSFGPERYWAIPTLCWIDSSDGFLQLLCGGGAFLSLLLIVNVAPTPILFLSWFFYLSLTTVCREFLSFQWDILLLETGFLAIFLSPLHLFSKSRHRSPPSPLILWLFAWLLFRLMFSSGVVKWASHDPTWRNLTALQYHYETQPLPTWIGWYVHQLPASFQRLSAIGMFIVELGVPFLIFAQRRIRQCACAAIVALQGLIALTGNYCFFNLLAVALCLFLLEDAFWPKRWREKIVSTQESSFKERRWPKWIIVPVAVMILMMTTVQVTGLFRRRIPWPRPMIILYRLLMPFRSVNSYGLFAVMTTSRPEIVVEGSNDGVSWLPYEFKYKPGDPKKRPAFIAPHQPRLDWQMWFAALGRVEENPWFLNFGVRLLQGSPDVLRLLSKNPFPDKPPRYLRATLYDYRFTDLATRRAGGEWWHRREIGPYCPVLSLQKQKRD